MIIQYNVFCKDYQEKILEGFCGGIKSKGQFCCPNPDCRSGIFHRHGTYERYLIEIGFEQPLCQEDAYKAFCDPEDLDSLIHINHMEILRIKCAGCGMTHAILPADAIPFLSGTVLAVLFLLFQICCENDGTLNEAAIHPRGIFSWQYLKYLRILYAGYRNRMVAALRSGGLYCHAEDPSDRDILLIYLSPPPLSLPYLSFLRFHKAPMFVRRRSTLSYPLRFLFPKTLVT